MKKLLLLSAALTLGLCAAARAHEGHDHGAMKDGSASGTYTGEVLDLACYLSHGTAGKDHQKCSKMCLTKDHVSAGLLTDDGKLFALVDDHKAMKAMEKVRELAAEKVKITGKQVSKGGLQAILVEGVEKL